MVKINEMKKVYKYLFENEEKFKSTLISTKGKTIVFNKPSEKKVLPKYELDSFLQKRRENKNLVISYWANGLFYDDPKNQNRKDWLGKNHLGDFLTTLRVQLLNEY